MTALQITESEDGVIVFYFEYSVTVGQAEIFYSPQPFIELLARKMDEQIKFYEAQEKPEVAAAFVRELWDENITSLARVIACLILAEFEESVLFFPLPAADFMEYLTSGDIEDESKNAQRKRIKQIIERRNSGRFKRLLAMEKEQLESITAPKILFCEVYDKQVSHPKLLRYFFTFF